MGAGQGSRIRARRKALELSVVQTAKAVGVSRAAYQKWEAADDMQIRRDHLKRLARVLRCSEAHVVDGGPIMPVKSPAPQIDTELLVDVLVGLETGLEGRTIAPEKKAEIVAALYEMFSASGARPDRATILQFARRVA